MGELVVVGVLAGFLAGISPCVLPVLPVVLVAGATAPSDVPRHQRAARPVAVVLGLVLSFSLLVLAGSEVLSFLHLPQDALRDAGIALLLVVGIGYLVPPVAALVERPFTRIRTREPSGSAGGFVLGLALGLVFVPCAGPILAAITVVGATHRVSPAAVVLTAAFAAGTAVPLLVIALAGEQLVRRARALRRHAPTLRRVGGAVLVVVAVAITFNAFDGLQRDVPGYSDALQGSTTVRNQLNALTHAPHTSLSSCNPNATGLVDCGPAPNFTGITAWLNTPGGKPLSIAALRGKVVLIDFWTYSCINCLRSLPYVRAWAQKYQDHGLVVIGVHTPEFAFEKSLDNVRSAVHRLGITYPVAVDSDYAIWEAFSNNYWPADYFIDSKGQIRGHEFGEGDYDTSERLIQRLLADAGYRDVPGGLVTDTGAGAEAAADVNDIGSGETYIGYARSENFASPQAVAMNQPATYSVPSTFRVNQWALAGRWTVQGEKAVLDQAPGRIVFRFHARDLHLVLGPAADGRPIRFKVWLDGKAPGADHGADTDADGNGVVRQIRLYQLIRQEEGVQDRTFTIEFLDPGVQAYSFTFG